MRRFASACLAAASALLWVYLPAAARPRYGGTLRVETSAAMRTLNPAAAPVDAADTDARRWLHPLIFETLVTPDAAGGLKPVLALNWESDTTATRWRFRMRSGVTLHDGTALDAGRVAAALSAQESGWVVTADAGIVTIQSGSGLPDLPWQLAEARHAIAFGRPEGGEPIGTGPFALERWEPKRLRLRAHDEHWAGRPFVDAVIVEMGRPLTDQIATLEAGRADVAALRPQDVRRAQQRGATVVASRPLELVALVVQGPFAAPAARPARQALTLAIDRASVADVLLQRQAVPAAALLPQWLTAYAALMDIDRDPARARSLVAGLPPPQRTLTLAAGSDPLLRSVAERVAVDAGDAGFSIALPGTGQTVPVAADLRLVRVRLEPTTPERALAAVMQSLGLRVPAGGAPPTPGASLDALYRVERAVLEPLVIVPLVHLREVYAFGPRVEAWNEPLVLPAGAWNLANLWLRPDTPFDSAPAIPRLAQGKR